MAHPDTLTPDIADRIAEGIAKGIALATAASARENAQQIASAIASTQPKRKVTNGEFARNPSSSWHPKGEPHLKLTRSFYQNGIRTTATQLNNHDIALINRITRSGRYIDRKFEVLVSEDLDPTNDGGSVDIRWQWQTPDQRMEVSRGFRDFGEILARIVAEQDQQDLDAATEKRERAELKEFRAKVLAGQMLTPPAEHVPAPAAPRVTEPAKRKRGRGRGPLDRNSEAYRQSVARLETARAKRLATLVAAKHAPQTSADLAPSSEV